MGEELTRTLGRGAAGGRRPQPGPEPALVSGSARVGVRRFRARGTTVEDISRLVADAELSYRMGGRTGVTFTAERDISCSFERASSFSCSSATAL